MHSLIACSMHCRRSMSSAATGRQATLQGRKARSLWRSAYASVLASSRPGRCIWPLSGRHAPFPSIVSHETRLKIPRTKTTAGCSTLSGSYNEPRILSARRVRCLFVLHQPHLLFLLGTTTISLHRLLVAIFYSGNSGERQHIALATAFGDSAGTRDMDGFKD